MPNITLKESLEQPYNLYKSDGVRVNTDTPKMISRETINRPVKVKRAKPADLFGNATARRVHSVSVEGSVGATDSYPTSPTAGYLTVAPWSYWKGGVSMTITDPSFQGLDGRIRNLIKDSNVNLAQALAEYQQTAGLFSSAVKDIAGIIRSIRSGRAGPQLMRALRQPPGKMSKDVANRWLQFQYGVRPLMSDIYGSAEALAKQLKLGEFKYLTVKSNERVVRTENGLFSGTYVIDYALKAKARYIVSYPGLKTLAETGITNPALLVWEVIPYSFVIDWFVPVGNWLASLDALAGVSQLQVNRSFRAVGEVSLIGKLDKVNAFSQAPRVKCREILSVRLAPSGNLSMPRLGYEPSLTLTKILNGMALLRQLR